MATVTEIEQLALDLPESERAVLAGQLLRSLPSVLHDADDGVAEALRVVAEMEARERDAEKRQMEEDMALARRLNGQ